MACGARNGLFSIPLAAINDGSSTSMTLKRHATSVAEADFFSSITAGINACSTPLGDAATGTQQLWNCLELQDGNNFHENEKTL